MPPSIRPGRDTDADSLIALIGACWRQYPGVILDVDAELPELRALASHDAGKGGMLWVAEADGRIDGMIATVPYDGHAWEICRVYVQPSRHGSGLGPRLLAVAEAFAREAGAVRLFLWSDTRFDRAHRFYEKHHYVRQGPIRVLDDLSNSLEFGYAKPVAGIEVLDAAAAASAVRPLAALLSACVDSGASVSFLPPLAADTSLAFWKRMAAGVAAGERILLAAWQDARLVGTAMLVFSAAPNQPHCADVQMLLVDAGARRRGVARALMQHLEAEAGQRGRTLLTLQTRAGDEADLLCRSAAWQEAGRIPGFTMNARGEACDSVLFWKRLPYCNR